jgi:hypothetical protein
MATVSAVAPTEIYVPAYQYPDGYDIETSAGFFTKEPGQMRLRPPNR